MVEEADIDAIKMCTANAQDRPVQSILSSTIKSVTLNILDKEVVAGCVQRATMKAVVRPSMIKGVFDVLSKNGILVSLIATSMSNCVEKSQTAS